MEESAQPGQLHRSSLGTLGFIGELYDARKESLSSRSLLKRTLPQELVKVAQMDRMELDYKFIENISDRFELLKVQGELQLPVLFGLTEVEGSARFLKESTKSGISVSCSLISRIQTVNEKLIVSSEEILPHIDLIALEDPSFTHVIVEILWGANCLLTLERSCNSEEEREDVKGRLDGKFSLLRKFLSVEGKADIEKEKDNFESMNSLDVKVTADVVPKSEWPTSVEAFLQFVKDIPKLLAEVNGGKGKPLSYIMIPLSIIRKMAKLESSVQTLVQKIDASFVGSITYFFEDVQRVKQKISDFLKLLEENKKYVRGDVVKEFRNAEREVSIKESELKTLLCDGWVQVRAGEKKLTDLVRKFEQFKSRSFNLFSYEDLLDSHSWITQKLSSVRLFTSQGIVYLGEGDTFEDLQRNHPSSEFIVMVTSSKMAEENPELSSNTSCYFLSQFHARKPETVYAVVDLDYVQNGFLNMNVKENKCFHLLGAKVLCRDLLAQYLAECETNYARRNSPGSELGQHKPGNRVPLAMPCPGWATGRCPHTVLEWKCHSCKCYLEYGFDDSFYCSCGRTPASFLEYRCSNPKHGDAFISASSGFLKSALSQLRPLREMNLLIIGQSGVGKSTWINSIVNYLSFDTIDEAKCHGAIVVIPAAYPMYHPKTLEKRVIQVGTKNASEVTETGESATQFSQTYSFIWENLCVRLIDTPGLGDNRGIAQDKNNLRNLIDHISHLKELHGVCILLKANDNRMNPLFTYTVKEFLVHLHRSVTRNIIFCFTNARASLYSPGAASVLIEKIIDSLEVNKELALGMHNRFTLDNEAFLYLCAEANGMEFETEVAESFKKSWNISLKETRRLFQTVRDFHPHQLKETVSLVKARLRVQTLTQPLVEVNKTIQVNLQTCKRKEEELNDKNLSVAELSKKLTLDEVYLIPEDLPLPRTVCTSPSCISYITYSSNGVQEIEYKTHCHVECYLKEVTPKTVNNPHLKNCKAMNSSGMCQNCGCSWHQHMHITYSQKRAERKVTNKEVESNFKKEMSEIEMLEQFMADLRKRIEKLEAEKKFITTATAKFGTFLRKNAISIYNDALEEYLLLLIDNEENKPHKSQQELNLLKNLKDNLEQYREEVAALTAAVERGSKEVAVLTPEGVAELEQELYSLEITGKTIKDTVELSRRSLEKAAVYSEHHIALSKSRRQTADSGKNVKNVLSTLYDYGINLVSSSKKPKPTQQKQPPSKTNFSIKSK